MRRGGLRELVTCYRAFQLKVARSHPPLCNRCVPALFPWTQDTTTVGSIKAGKVGLLSFLPRVCWWLELFNSAVPRLWSVASFPLDRLVSYLEMRAWGEKRSIREQSSLQNPKASPVNSRACNILSSPVQSGWRPALSGCRDGMFLFALAYCSRKP